MVAGCWQRVIEISGQEAGWEVRQWSFSDRINMKWRHPQGVID